MFNTWLKRAANGRRQALRLDIHTPDHFKSVLDRERARSDRSGSSFALVTCETRSIRRSDTSLQTMAQFLKGQVRDIDDVGLLGMNQLGLVLPDTDHVGARILANRAKETLKVAGIAIDSEIYVYPAECPSSSVDSNNDNYRNDNHDDYHDGKHDDTRNLEPAFAAPLPAWKRLIDITGAVTVGVMAAPIMLIAGVAIKMSSRGPILFVQEREGLGGRRFKMWKLRTMCVDADAMKQELRQFSEQDGPAFKIRNDPRITRVGRLLRATSIDELPQLWNVLKGDMSLVGPRPLPRDESAACDSWQRRRLDVTPGLTCIWQVKGRSSVSFDDWMRMDQQYVRSRSIWMDISLLLFTVPAVIKRKGAQ